jgi:hypothetical protein
MLSGILIIALWYIFTTLVTFSALFELTAGAFSSLIIVRLGTPLLSVPN